jgi:hypothetical protein
MERYYWILWAAFGVLVLTVAWPPSSTRTGPATIVDLSSDPPRSPAGPPTERIALDGLYYGGCSGVTLAVVLDPEPCGWDRAQPRQMVAGR